MDRKWTESGPEVDRKWTESGPKVDQKWIGSRPKLDRKFLKIFEFDRRSSELSFKLLLLVFDWLLRCKDLNLGGSKSQFVPDVLESELF